MNRLLSLPLLILLLLIGGCAALDAAQGQISVRGARAADETRESAEWALCNGITVGAWRRAYGTDPQRAQGWSLLCAPPAAPQLPVEPAPRTPGVATWTS